MSECDGSIEHCKMKGDLKEVVKQALLEEQDTMQPLRCKGHQELFREVTEARSDIRHLSEKVDQYMQRKDKADSDQDALILDLRLHGAGISQQNAADIVALDGRLSCVEKLSSGESAVEHWYDNRLAQLGIVCMILFGVLGVAFEIYRFVREVLPH